ncbi:Ig-like domain-containing protein, partial [Pluralibacter gergoviae]|uniref:Ig-like domain-containing protein n=1 Tax=Pluralibacter gergoviae TaxID=61647 RepID=UPI00366CCE49
MNAGGSLNDNTPTVSGRAEPGSTVTVYDGATELGHAVADEDGSWRIILPTLEDGTYDNLTA